MDLEEPNERHPIRSAVAICFVVGLHVSVVYAFVTGLAHKVIEIHLKPVFTKIVDEIKPIPPPEPPKPPPPTPPPKEVQKPVAHKVKPPPLSWAPKAEVQTTPSEARGITAVSDEKPPTSDMSTSTAQPSKGGEISHVDAKIAPDCKKPEYPRSSLRNNEQGVVDVRLTISATGEVIDSEVVKSSGFPDLDKATSRAWSLCHFAPAMHDGQAVESKTVIEYVWKIEE